MRLLGIHCRRDGICTCRTGLTFREAVTRHRSVYYQITNAHTHMECQTEDQDAKNYHDYAYEISQLVVTQVEDYLGYVFRRKSTSRPARDENQEISDDVTSDEESNDEEGDNDEEENGQQDQGKTTQGPTYFKRFYRCSQDISSAGYSKYDKSSAVPKRKRRQRTVLQRYGCAGSLHVWIPNNANGATVQLPQIGTINLRDGEILLHLSHKCPHPPRERKPVPKLVRDFIRNPDNTCRSTFEMYKKLSDAAKAGKLGTVEMVDITDDNVRYWLLQTQKQDYLRHHDPWVSAVALLREEPDVTVHSYIERRRRFFCWYFPKLFDIDLATVTEVYIDSTFSTNGQNAELFAIIACENGYGVPVAYMLMEKKPTDDSKKYPGEVIEACTKFFFHAKELGLYPIIAHTDKSPAELAGIKVRLVHAFD